MPYPAKIYLQHKMKLLQKQKFLVVISMIHLFTLMTEDDEMFYMPCKTHEEYEDKSENEIRTTIRTHFMSQIMFKRMQKED